MTRATSRRAFLESSALAIPVLFGLETARGYAAGETITVGCLGTGGRCQGLMRSLAKVPGVKIAAVCDVYDPHLASARKLADPQALATKHFHEVLERKDIDAVLIGAPDHWHTPMTIAACQAGKDVYVEKPVTHDLGEGARLLQARDDSKRVIQVGMQQRSMPHIQKAYSLMHEGRLGRVFRVHLTWNRGGETRMRKGPMGVDPHALLWKDFLGSAPDQPFDEYRFRNWRWFWDFGGGILTDLMVHWIDVAHWFLGVDHPEKAAAFGDQLASKGVWQTPDTIQCVLEYPGESQAHFEGTFSNAHRGAMITFMGTQATLYIDRGGFILTPEPSSKAQPESWILGTNPKRGLDFYDKPDAELFHLTNWIDRVRDRGVPAAPVEAGIAAAAAAHLGNQAFRSGQVAHWTSA